MAEVDDARSAAAPPRALGMPTAIFLIVASMIGAGVFTTTGFLVADLGSTSAVLAAWALGGLTAICGALAYAELAAALPHNGGEYTLLSRIYHPAVGFVAGWNLLYQFWIHTEAIDKMPKWFEAVMNTPSHHRVHHATNPRYLDTNYAGVFIVWDKMFGTFVPELKEDPPVYGIVKPVGSYNPFVVAFHEFFALMRDCARDGLRPDKWFGRFVNAPGWSPDGANNRSIELKQAYVAAHPDQAGRPGLPR